MRRAEKVISKQNFEGDEGVNQELGKEYAK